MSDRLKALREKRGRLVTEMRAITDKAQAEKRDLTTEETQAHERLFTEQEQLRGNIQAEERQAEIDRQLAAEQADREEQRQRAERGERATVTTVDARTACARLGVEYRAGWDAAKDAKAMASFRSYLKTGTILGEGAEEFRALQAGSGADGGYLVAPMEFVAELIIFVNNNTFMRQKARGFRVTTGASMGAPSLDADPDDADWTTELATGSEDGSMKFGRRELYPHPLAKRIKVSRRLLRIAAMPVEQIVMQRLGYKFAVTGEKGYLTGSGQEQPLGVFTASNDGIPTSRDVSTGNTTTAITIDGLKEAKYSLKSQYWNRAEWIFHRDAVKLLSKLKDGDGQYLWQSAVTDKEPDRLLGSAVNISEYAPNTFTTGLYVGLYGDLSQYWIADALDMQVQRLTELYAETNQDGFIGRLESDGMPVLAEAFARVKLA